MNRRALWLFSWLLCVLVTHPFVSVPRARFTFAQMRHDAQVCFARGTFAWLLATGLAVWVMRRWFRRGSDVGRSLRAGLGFGLFALAVYAVDLVIEVSPPGRGPFLSFVAMNSLVAGFAAFAAAYWTLGGHKTMRAESPPNHPPGDPASPKTTES